MTVNLNELEWTMIDRSIFKIKGLFSTYLGLTLVILYTWLPEEYGVYSHAVMILGLSSFLLGIYTGIRFELFSKRKKTQATNI